jgi:hypothetical protein
MNKAKILRFYFLKQALFISLIFLTCLTLKSQTYLVLENQYTGKRHRFYPGDYVKIITADKVNLNGFINQITDSTLLIDDTRIFLKQISAMKFERPKLKWAFSAGLAGMAFTTVTDGANQLFNEGEGLSLSQAGKNLNLVFGGISLVSYPFINFKRRSGKRWKFKIFNHTPIIPRKEE